jgi:hypothetical protein
MTLARTSSCRSASVELYLYHFDNLCEVALVAVKSCREIVGTETDLSDDCLDELQEKLERYMEE